MATIRAFTTIEQSRKLAEILPLESADMCYPKDAFEYNYAKEPVCHYSGIGLAHPCWSLAALLNVLPKDEGIGCDISFGYYNGKGEYIEKWLCAFEKEGETIDDFIFETIDGDNPVDACYEMIIKIKELNLL